MLHAFVSARAIRPARRSVCGLSASVATHAGIVGLAVVATAGPIAPPHTAASIGVEHVVFTGITPSVPLYAARAAGPAAHRVRRTAPRSRGAANVYHAPRLDDAQFEFVVAAVAAMVDVVPIDVVDVTRPDLVAMASEGIQFDRNAIRELTGAPKPLVRLAGGAYPEDAVEKVVAPYGSNPRPRYPSALQAENVEGSFIVRFVVDSTGRVDRHTFDFPAQVHRLFVKSVRDALTRSRFIPAELAGRRVSQLVQQRFSFVMEAR